MTSPADPDELLVEVATLATEAGASELADAAHALRDRLHDGRFFVACLGQFKRGKSTLVNALIGEPLLPSGVAPVTSVVTIVRAGPRRARVRLGAAGWRDVALAELPTYVTEAENPANQRGVTGVEVSSPSPLLAHGLCLVDTPGIGSVIAANSAETRAFVPHIDAAVVVLGGDPPISGDELALVRDVARHVPALLFVINKADRLDDGERREAIDFTRQILTTRLGLAEPALFEVSALERLRGVGAPRDWPALCERLARLADDGAALMARAAARGIDDLIARLERQLAEQRAALRRPLDETQRRLEALRGCARDADRATAELRHLFDAEQQRLARRLRDERDRFVAASAPDVERRLDERLATAPSARGPAIRRFALAQAQEVAEALVQAWLAAQRPVAEREFAAGTARLVDHANAFLDRLATDGRLPADALPARLVPAPGLGARSLFHFAAFMTMTTPSPWRWLTDWLRTAGGARVAARAAALAFARHLIEINASRVVGDFDQRVTESRREIEAALRRTLRELVTTAERAADLARTVHAAGATASAGALAALAARQARLDALRPAPPRAPAPLTTESSHGP